MIILFILEITDDYCITSMHSAESNLDTSYSRFIFTRLLFSFHHPVTLCRQQRGKKNRCEMEEEMEREGRGWKGGWKGRDCEGYVAERKWKEEEEDGREDGMAECA